MIKKLMLTSLLLLGGAIGLHAKQYGIEIKVVGGEAPGRSIFYLDEQPQVTYNENQELVLTLSGVVEFTLPHTAGMQVRFVADDDNPTENAQIEEEIPNYTFSNGQFSLSGLKPGTVVRVLNVQGQVQTVVRIGADGLVELPLPQGISIVTVNNDWSMKVNKNN